MAGTTCDGISDASSALRMSSASVKFAPLGFLFGKLDTFVASAAITKVGNLDQSSTTQEFSIDIENGLKRHDRFNINAINQK